MPGPEEAILGELLNAAGRCCWRGSRRRHETETLKQKYGALRGVAPDQLAPFSLAILHVNITARIFEAAVPERTIDEHTVIQLDMLVFKGLAFVPVHCAHGFPTFAFSFVSAAP